MSQYTENYHLEKPESNDDFENFLGNYGSNMDIIDEHLGQGGGGSSVSWNQLQVTGDKIATIRISGIDTDVYSPNARTFSMAISRANINSGEDYSTIFGKIKKYFADLKTVAFTGNSSDLNNDAGFITNTVNNLANYYLKSETYTQAEVNALIGAITTIHFEVVQTLPTSDIQTNVIYLVPKSTAGTNDVYDEYINTTGTSAGWELIGSTQVDLSNYYTKTQTDTLLDGKVSDVKVNDTSVVDSSHVANITSYEEVTIAQYNALPASKKNCGIAYFIKDLDNASVEGYPPLIYSLEEREVGVWTDGKPLYQITFELSTSMTIPNNSWQSIGVNPTNGEKIINCWGMTEDYSCAPFLGWMDGATFKVQTTRSTSGSYSVKWVTVLYTKTTDTAGSGTWNGQGGLAHHYSTNETVIGTWIDGKPLYEKTIPLSFTGTPQTFNDIDLGLGTAITVHNAKGYVTSQSGQYLDLFSHLNRWGLNLCIGAWIDLPNIRIAVGNDMGLAYTGYVILQYTKTTD